MSTPGWGSIDKKISDRQRETRQDLDLQANMELGKFFGEKSGIKIPTYAGYTIGIVNPQYAPLAPDIEFNQYVDDAFSEKDQQDSVRNIQQTIVTRKSLNFTNVHKEKTDVKSKPQIYDISNFAVDYAYNSTESHDFQTEFDDSKSYQAGISYQFSPSPLNVKPFGKLKFLNYSHWFDIIKDFNFNPYPNSFGVSTDVDRQYQESLTRNNNPELLRSIPVYVNKSFNWDRDYSLRWNFTKGLKFDFTANNKALIQETAGRPSDSANWKETVLESVKNFGTTTNYNHATNVTWLIPINQIPVLDWTTSTFKYGSTYRWEREPFISENMGNTIQNTQNIQLNGGLNFIDLYGKSKYLKNINKKKPKSKKQKERSPQPVSPSDTTKDGKKKKAAKSSDFLDAIVRGLMMVRKGNIGYSKTGGTMLPGYNSETEIVGMSPDFSSPGWGFILGQQSNFGEYDSYLDYAVQNDWLVKNPEFNNQYRETTGENLNMKLTLEPLRDFKVDLNTGWSDVSSYSSYNRYYDSLGVDAFGNDIPGYREESPIYQGSFNTSFWMMRTAFESSGPNNTSAAFEQFSDNRLIISKRLGEASPESDGMMPDGYYDGYGPNQPEVLIPAFLAAYSGQDAENVSTNIFSKIYVPDIRITYSGLSKMPSLKKIFRNINITSGYKSSYTVGGYTSNILFDDGDNVDGFTAVRDENSLYNNFVSQYNFSGITIKESFNPLLNIDVTLQNTIQIRFEVKKDRTLNLSTQSSQVSEAQGQEITVGMGYTFKQLRAPFQNKANRNAIKSDFKIRADFSLRDNIMVIRELDTEVNPNNPTNGQKTLSIKLTGDYSITRKLNLRIYFDFISNTPVISLSYPNSTTNGGFSIRYNLSG